MTSTMSTGSRRTRTWTKDHFFISTDPALVPIPQLISAFASEEFYWAVPLPEDDMRQMLENSMVFAIYESADRTSKDQTQSAKVPATRELIGFARCVGDFVTFAYLTDVWVKPTYQGKGLGAWLIECIDEFIEAMPHLRRALLFTGDWKRSVPFYEKLLGMKVLDCKPGEGLAIMEKKGRAHPSYGMEGSTYR